MKPATPTFLAVVAATTLALTASAQQRVANFEFDNDSVTSISPSPASASDIVATNTTQFGGPASGGATWLCLTTDWNTTGGSLSWTVTPAAGTSISLTTLTWEARTNVATRSDSVRAAEVFVNGTFVERIDPLTHNTDVIVDLSGVPGLRPTFAPVSFEIQFEGNPTGETSYEIDNINVQASSCVENLSTGRARTVRLPVNGATGDARFWRALDGFEFKENADGTADLRGALINLADPCQRFTLEATLGGRVNPGMTAPTGSPKVNSLVTNNLVSNGGSVDTDTWRYYTTLTGTLRGRLCLEGAMLSIGRQGEALQIGDGANLQTLEMGLSSGFDANVMSQPSDPAFSINSVGSGEVNLELGGGCVCLASDVADWSNYGRGVAGCDGVPALVLQRDPLVGSAPAIDIASGATSATNCAMFWSLRQDSFFLPIVGGNILVEAPFASVDPLSVPVGGTTFNCNIRPDPCQDGWDVFIQVVCLDPCGPAGFSLSRGLRIGLGSL